MATSVASTVKFFPTAQNGFSTTLASTIAGGATTVPLNSVAGYTNGDVVVLVIEPTSQTAKQTFTGVIDTAGVQVTSVVWTAGSNQSHNGGVAVVDYETATHWALSAKGWRIAHNEDGTHKSGATYLLPTIASFANANHDHTNSAGGGAIGTGAVSAAALATSAITLGYAQITSTFVGPANGTPTQVTGLTVTVTIPAGGRRIKITVFSNGLSCSGANQYATAHIWDGTVGSGTQLSDWQIVSPAGGYTYGMTMLAVVSPAAGSKTYNVGVTGSATPSTTTLTASAVYPAFILVEAI